MTSGSKSPPYMDHFSPKMGLVVDRDSIFVLGGFPLSVKQYARNGGSLTNTFMERMCLSMCVDDDGDISRGGLAPHNYQKKPGFKFDRAALEAQRFAELKKKKGMATKNKVVAAICPEYYRSAPCWDGRKCDKRSKLFRKGTVKPYKGNPEAAQKNLMEGNMYISLKNAIWDDPNPNATEWKDKRDAWDGQMSPSLMYIMPFSQVGSPLMTNEYIVSKHMNFLGGALVAEKDKSGVATHLYGLTHCGTLFMIEPAKKRSTVLMHIGDPTWQNMGRLEVSLAFQKYDTPLGTAKILYMSIATKSFSERFTPLSEELPEYAPVTHKIFKVRLHDLLECRKLTTEKDRAANCVKIQDNKHGTCTVPLKATWFGWKTKNTKATEKDLPCAGHIEEFAEMQDARTLQVSGGSLVWYGGKGFELKQKSLDVAISCKTLWAALEEPLKNWCPGQQSCMKKHPKPLMLQEGLKKWPWDLTVYKKTQGATTKIIACTRPTQPTTRKSPETCCTRAHAPESDKDSLITG